MIEPRVYRAAFLPAIAVALFAMFSLESRPPALPQGLAADILFDGRLARVETARIVRAQPDRRPGSPGNEALANSVAGTLAERGFETQVDRFRSEGERLVNVVARRVGASPRQVIVMAPRDSIEAPDASGSASDTAALLELSRVLEGRATRKTLVFVSVDGSTLGGAGARRFASTLPDPEVVDGLIVLSNLGAQRAEGSQIVPWSNDTRRVSLGLEATTTASVGQELDRMPGRDSTLSQLARMALPLGLGDQGVLLERRIEAIRVSGSGELAPERPAQTAEEIDPDRIGALGRAALRTVSALDSGPRPEHGPESYLTLGRTVLPGWSLVLLSLCLLLPPLVASIDAFARARRRRAAVGPYLRWLAAATLPWIAGLVVAELIVLAGQAPDAPPAPLEPGAEPLDAAAATVLGGVAATVALSWILLRPLVARGVRVGSPPAAGAGVATALVLSLAGLLAWLLNPYAALVLVPALHAWTLLLLAPRDPPRRWGRALALALGLAAPVLVVLVQASNLGLGPLEGLWYGFLLVTGHQVGLASSLLAALLLGALSGVVAVAAARGPRESERDRDQDLPRILGPGGYAGPGSLGGTESALRQ